MPDSRTLWDQIVKKIKNKEQCKNVKIQTTQNKRREVAEEKNPVVNKEKEENGH